MSALVFAWEKGKVIECKTSINPNKSKSYTLKGALFFGLGRFAAIAISAQGVGPVFLMKRDTTYFISMPDGTLHCDEIYEYVLLLVVKGNLRHRIEKLGTEKTDEELNKPQFKLRRIVYEQTQPHWYVEKAYERPQWANGAFVYLSQGHARVIESVIRV